MGLFKKEKTIPTATIKCPVCGKEHVINVYNYDGVYLDNMPTRPVSQAMEMWVECEECGLLYSAEQLSVNWSEKLHSDEYQAARARTYDSITERKLALWDALLHRAYIPMYAAHYYHEIGNVQKEQEALDAVISSILAGKYKETYIFDMGKFCAMRNYGGPFTFTPKELLVELYRRTSRWDEACKQIEKLRNAKYVVTPYSLFEYLKVQEKLIKKKNSDLR